MSAILKALRKVEQEASGESPVHAFSTNLDPRKVIRRRAREAWILRRRMSFLSPALFLAALIVLGVALKPLLPGARSFFSPRSPVHGGEEKAVEHPAPSKKPASAAAPGRLPQEGTAPAETAYAAESSRTGIQGQQMPSAAIEGLDTDRIFEGTKTPPILAQSPSHAEPGPPLELQAIVWSDDPASCFAVINGRIVRSGGMVDGVAVVEIGRETVSLKLGHRTWTLRILEGD